MTDKRALGAFGEELAAQYLREAGMEILARNWRCRYGELDLIVREAELTAFVEVKTRSGFGFGTPAEAVTFAKQQRIRAPVGLPRRRALRLFVDLPVVLAQKRAALAGARDVADARVRIVQRNVNHARRAQDKLRHE